ncbi:MAG: protein-glutamate O-methyltransferase CheR [Chitinophagaceae bacterium]|nr:protein-glutamate O-methyltransferase CheR [Chitinophagaceae bacterium]
MKPEPELSLQDVEDIVEVIHSNFGYDFKGYARASLQRRMLRVMDTLNIKTAGQLQDFLLGTDCAFNYFLEHITVNVTEMFRDPEFYKIIRSTVIPILASYPIIKIWHAGCSTGEEVFSMAILLHEAGLLQRSRIYGTDVNHVNIEKAKQGILPLEVMKDYTHNYMQSGGVHDFATYYSARYKQVIIDKKLRSNLIFAQHNLVADQVFNEFQLIFCRNVLIYFNKELQNKVVKLFYDSLAPLGYLALGSKETMHYTPVKHDFATVDKEKIYRRIK